MSDQKALGTAGEMVVAAALVYRGWRVSREITDSAKYDLLAFDPGGSLKRIQVKVYTNHNGYYVNREKVISRKKFLYTKDDVDLMVYWFVDTGYIALVDIEAFGDKKNMKLLPSPVEPDGSVLRNLSGVRFLSGAPFPGDVVWTGPVRFE